MGQKMQNFRNRESNSGLCLTSQEMRGHHVGHYTISDLTDFYYQYRQTCQCSNTMQWRWSADAGLALGVLRLH
ncbi:hypothetical protein LZ31DRAFT_180521 [Colletotrichum somersetense]|nr:hypothetical protein LZ31DRAFT_180521 [Colletotrichum somersetense]